MKKTFTLLFTSLMLAATVSSQVPRKVLVEDFTGEWCGWCPLGRTAAEHLEATFPDQVINMGQHYGDPLACGYSNALSAYDSYGYPGFMINRTQSNGNLWHGVGYTGAELDGFVQQELSTTAPLGVGITSTYNTSTRVLNITVTATFEAAQSGTMRMSCVLIQDSVSTPGLQHNYMNTMNSTPWFGHGDPITTYYQRDVVRQALSGTWGDANVIPTTGVLAGEMYSKTYTYTVPVSLNASHMSIVAFVSHYANLPFTITPDTTQVDVINANVARFGETVTGMETVNANVNCLSIYPNPSSGEVFIPLTVNNAAPVTVKIYDMTGREVITLTSEMLSQGDHTLRWDAEDESGASVSNGIYLCQITSGEATVTRRIVINR